MMSFLRKCGYGPIWMFVLILVILVETFEGRQQVATSTQQTSVTALTTISKLPKVLTSAVGALGGRVQAPGKERTVYVGSFTDSAGTRPATVISELPLLLGVIGADPKTPALTFDGANTSGTLSQKDESILESLSEDTVEGLFASVNSGWATRFLGKGFGPNPKAAAGYTGQRYDIFEVTGPSRTDQQSTMRLKRYFLDSSSGVLLSTRYSETTLGQSVSVETRFSNWTAVGNSFYAGKIDRYENGNLVFSFVANNITAGSAEGVNGLIPQ